MKKSGILKLLFLIITIIGFFYIKHNLTFGFFALFIFLSIFLILPLIPKEQKAGKISYDAKQSTLCSFLILIFGGLALYALGNYFNAKPEIYKNYNHHALRIDGVKVKKLPFNLAGHNSGSFIDNPFISGNIKVTEYDDDSVTLSLNGVTNAIYRKYYNKAGEPYAYECLDSTSRNLIRFDAVGHNSDEWITLISEEKDENNQYRQIQFQIIEDHVDGLFKSKKDSIQCIFINPGNLPDTSSFHYFIKSGYTLEGIATDIPTKFNLTGINIVRGSISLKAKHRDVQKIYGNKKRHYFIEIQDNSTLRAVQVGTNTPVNIADLRQNTSTIKVPYNRSVFVGSGTDKSESIRFSRSEKDNSLIVTYELPKYQYLTSCDNAQETSLMVTTTIVNPNNSNNVEDAGLIDNLTDNVLLFDLFDKEDNSFHIAPFFISYIAGSTNDRMEFSVLTKDAHDVQYGIPAGEYIPNIKSHNGTEWLIQVENFKDTTPFKATTLCWILLVIIVLCAISINVSKINLLYTTFEYAAYLLIIGFLSVRFFLMWRMTAFPPVSSISLYEFNHFRDSDWLNFVIYLFAFFIVGINIIKYGLHRHLRRRNSGNNQWETSILTFFDKQICRYAQNHKVATICHYVQNHKVAAIGIAIFVLDIIILIVAKLSGRPIVSVFAPVLFFFIADAAIYALMGSSYIKDLQYDKEKPSEERKNAFLLSMWNMLCTSFVTLAADGGYGIMFTMFAIFSLWYKIVDLFQYTRYPENRLKLVKWLFWGLFIILVAIIFLYKKIFIGLLDSILNGNVWIFLAVAGVIVLVIAVSILPILGINLRQKRFIVFPVLLLFAILAAGFLSPHIKGSHMEYRARVHMEPVGVILYNIDSSKAQEKFLQASLNDWILFEYRQIGNDIKSFGEDGVGYFKLQPQSKIGAMWFAQTTDICIARYIIAEHGKWLPCFFVLVYAILLGIGLRGKSNQRWIKLLCIQVALLMAVQTLMILLANTQAFIFFGQDFPLISITSRLSSIYFFVLMFLATAGSIIGKYDYNVEKFNYNSHSRNNFDDAWGNRISEKSNAVCRHMLFFFLVSASILYLGRTDINRGNFTPKEKRFGKISSGRTPLDLNNVQFYKDNKYDVDTLLTAINGELESKINPRFVEYQELHGVPALKHNMSKYVYEVFQDSIMRDALGQCSPFTQRMIDNYITRGSKSNSIKNIICLRNTISYKYIKRLQRTYIAKHDTLEFVTSLNFCKYELPHKIKSAWRGNLVEVINDIILDSTYIAPNSSFTSAYIPKEFTSSGKAVQLIKTKSKPMKVIGSDALISINKDLISVVNLSTTDYLINNGKCVNNTPLQRYRYIARNILLNGKRTFVYPNGHKMLWARDIVSQVVRKNKNESKDEDVVLYINSDLTNSLYDCYAKTVNGGGDRAVIVADGDGLIRAMVDYRADKKFRINPNDIKRIGKISDSLYLNREKGRTIETRYFGNFAQNTLRCGPGSSQKPILWSAVTSMYNTGWWSSLELKGIPRIPMSEHNDQYVKSNIDGSKYTFSKFAGHRIESKFRSIRADEGNGNNVNLQFYIYKSSNYYNALMAYLGSFRGSDFENNQIAKSQDATSIFYSPHIPVEPAKLKKQSNQQYVKSLNTFADNYYNLFPIMSVNGKSVAFNKFLDKNHALDTMALAPKGLKNNFGLCHRTDISRPHPYSYFNMAIRSERTTPRQLNEYMVRSVAIGSNSVWNVSPSKMAEMYGRLITLNKSYKLTLWKDEDDKKKDDVKCKYDIFDIDDSWERGYVDYQKVRKDLICGMSKVFSEGTAKSFNITNKTYDGNCILLVDNNTASSHNSNMKKLYIYGKTGTINGFWGKDKVEDHLLATIITDREISTCTEEELKQVKFYVIYQADYDYKSRWATIDKQILLTILNSKAFKDYMGLN